MAKTKTVQLDKAKQTLFIAVNAYGESYIIEPSEVQQTLEDDTDHTTIYEYLKGKKVTGVKVIVETA